MNFQKIINLKNVWNLQIWGNWKTFLDFRDFWKHKKCMLPNGSLLAYHAHSGSRRAVWYPVRLIQKGSLLSFPSDSDSRVRRFSTKGHQRDTVQNVFWPPVSHNCARLLRILWKFLILPTFEKIARSEVFCLFVYFAINPIVFCIFCYKSLLKIHRWTKINPWKICLPEGSLPAYHADSGSRRAVWMFAVKLYRFIAVKLYR